MSRYGSVTLGLPAALLSTTVESAEAADLEARANAAIQAVPVGYRIVAITLAGAGDGALFSVTIEAGLLASVEGGFSTGPTVKCFLAATAEELTALGQTTNPTSGTLADLQVAGASQGLRRMGMFVSGTIVLPITDQTFPNPQALEAFDATLLPDQSVVEVGVVNDSYRYIQNPTPLLLTAVDGLNVIAPAAPAGAVFERLYLPNQNAWYQTAWTVDPVAGDDRNPGTALAPLKTLEEWANRMRDGVVMQDVTVTCLAGTVNTKPIDLRLRIDFAANALVRIVGTTSVDGGHSVTAVTASVPTTVAGTNVRGFITSADAFTNKSRIRFTSGVRNGYTCQVTGFNVPNTSAFISTPGILSNLHPSFGITPTTGFPAINDTYVVETLLTDLNLSSMNIEISGAGRLVFENFNMRCSVNLPVCRGGNPGNFSSSILFYNCIAPSAAEFIWFSESQVACVNCAFDAFFASVNNSVVFVRTCVFRLASGSGLSVQCVEGGYIQYASSNCFDSAGANIDHGFMEFNGGDCQWCDGPSGSGFQVFGKVYVHNGALIWGGSANSGNAFARFLRVFSGGGIYSTTGSAPTVGPNVTSDVLVGNFATSYAAIPYINATNLASYTTIA